MVQKQGDTWRVSGNGVIPNGVTLTVNAGETLNVPANATLTNNGSLVNDGGTITVSGKLQGNKPDNYQPPTGFTYDPYTFKANVPETLPGPASYTENTTLVPRFTYAVADAGTTGAVIEGTTMTAYGAGTVKVRVWMQDGYCKPVEQIVDFQVSFTPVTEITADLPEEFLVNKSYTLPTAVVTPENASYRTVQWSVAENDLGATLDNGVFRATKAGTVTLRATVENGTAYGTAYTKNFPVTVKTVQEGDTLTIDGGNITIRKNENGTLRVLYAAFGGEGYRDYAADEEIVITGETNGNRIVVESGSPHIVLSDCKITLGQDEKNSPFTISSGADVQLTLRGDNLLKSTFKPVNQISSLGYAAGVLVPAGAAVTIDGDGTLEAVGGYGHAGIGGAYRSKSAGDITIQDGTIIARNGGCGTAGIGGAYSGSVERITITGGTVQAYGNDGGAAIGAGNDASGDSEIVITGGNIYTSGPYGVGNGKRGSGCTVTDGNGNTLSKFEFTLDGLTESTALTAIEGSSYGLTGVYTLQTNKIYLYLPADTDVKSVTAGENTYHCKAGNIFYKDHLYSAVCDTDCNHCGKTREAEEHKYDADGICSVCHESRYAVLDPETNCYQIANAGQLLWFTKLVNGTLEGVDRDSSANAVLLNDIDMTGMDGYVATEYSGTFDGNGHTLKIRLDSTEQYAAPFRYVKDATIRNLTVEGTVTTSAKFAAGIVGKSDGKTTLENCLSRVVIVSSVDGDGTHGGLAANVESGTLSIKNCGFTGKIEGTKTHSCGGMVGWSKGTTTISNSFVAAEFENTTNCNTFARNNVTVTNSYYLKALGGVPGGAVSLTAEQFADGEAAWLLNGGADNGVWKQKLPTDQTPNFSGDPVYQTTGECPGYVNSAAEKDRKHAYDDEWDCCTNCGALKKNADGYYEINSVEKLFCFAAYVNAGEYSTNAKLLADLDLTGMVWTPIAYLAMNDKASVGYEGIFDGGGHVISNITIATPTSATANGFFGIVTTGTVKQLGIRGLTFDNDVYDHRAGGIAGQLMTGGTIDNCFVADSTVKASTRVVGGIVGLCKGTVKNCYTVNLSLAGANNRFGGITGDYKDGSIVNCYTDQAAPGSTKDSVGTKDDLSQAGVSAARFASGEIAYLLNGGTVGLWKQTLETDQTPGFTGESVYQMSPCVGYTNNKAEESREHVVENGVCKTCGALMEIVSAIWNESGEYYEIYSASQLVWFAGLVNGTLDGVDQDQSADAVLMNDIDMAIITDYVPIGGTTGLYYSAEGEDKGYQGVFDGGGHVIRNLSVKGSDTDERTYGVFGTLSGTVKQLGVENFTFTLGNKDCRAGGIAGQMLANGLIEDCYVASSTVAASGKVAGGIAGCNYAGTIKNCHSYQTTVTASRSGGIVGDNRGDGGADDRKGEILNCYTDSGAVENSQRTGTVISSEAGVKAEAFASGRIGFLLDGGRGLWKQEKKYPAFSGEAIAVDEYAVTDALISAKITWTDMEFTYAGGWDPETHAYGNEGGGSWQVADGGGTVTVENVGEQSFYSKFAFNSQVSGVTGIFDKDNPEVGSKESVTAKLTLTGAPNRQGFQDMIIGSIDITLRLKITPDTWQVGDDVKWYAADGNAYECHVLSKDDTQYVLVTKSEVYRETGQATGYESKLTSMGARLPRSDAEIAYAKERCLSRGLIGSNKYLRTYGGKYFQYYVGGWNSASPYSWEYVYTWAVFEVPIQIE